MAETSLATLIEVLCSAQYQDIEDAAQSLLGKWDIANRTGEPLKDIARLVGLQEFPSDTDQLRAYIYAKIGANTSDGTFRSLYAIWKAIVEGYGGTVARLVPVYPQQIQLQTDVVLNPEIAETIVSLIQSATSAEVLINGIEEYAEPGDGVFMYDDGLAADAYDSGGYGDYMRLR